MDTALIVLAIVFGLCLVMIALTNMGPGAIFFIGLCILFYIISKIVDAIKDRKKKDV